MAKRIQRAEPPYVQIAEHYQGLIKDGTLAEGDRLPSVRQIADEWGVVRATANRSVRYLEAAQLVDITKRGTVVGKRRATATPRDRMLSRQRSDTENIIVADAGYVTRAYVARILGLDDDDAAVIRREQITYQRGEPITLSVHWLPGSLGDNAPALLNVESLDTLTAIYEGTGRVPTVGSDGLSSRAADEREASALGLSVGTSVLAGVWTYSDDKGMIEYGEYVAPPDHVVTYDYAIAPEGALS